MASVRMTAAVMMVDHVVCEQTLTQKADKLFLSWNMPDLFGSMKDRRYDTVKAPSWEAVNAAKATDKEGQMSSQRTYYYATMISLLVTGTCTLGSIILAANHIVQQCCRARYAQVPQHPANASMQHTRSCRKGLALTLFLAHVAAWAMYLLEAARQGELTAQHGLSWERWVFLVTGSCVWCLSQVLWAVCTCRASAKRFSAGTFPKAMIVYFCPVVSDGFDSCKDVAFVATLQTMDALWLKALGWACLVWLISVYTVMILKSDESEDSCLMTFASVATEVDKQVAEALVGEVAEAGPPNEEQPSGLAAWLSMTAWKTAMQARWTAAKEMILVVLFAQTTEQKRRLLLWEDRFQGFCAIIAIVGQGGSVRSFLFIAVMNIGLPASKFLFGTLFHTTISNHVLSWLVKEADVARNAGLNARFSALQSKLVDMLEADFETEKVFPAGSPVADPHARLVAWHLQEQDIAGGKWSMNGRSCQFTSNGWKALLSRECGLSNLALNHCDIDSEKAVAIANIISREECALTTLEIRGNNIGDVGAKALAEAVAKEECGLTSLNLGENGIGPEGANALATALRHQECGLTSLNLRWNRIGPEGVNALATALRHQECGLTSLNLGENGIGPEGANALATALRHQDCRLEYLDLCRNFGLDASSERILRDAAKPWVRLLL